MGQQDKTSGTREGLQETGWGRGRGRVTRGKRRRRWGLLVPGREVHSERKDVKRRGITSQ